MPVLINIERLPHHYSPDILARIADLAIHRLRELLSSNCKAMRDASMWLLPGSDAS
jgi:hypothetical protein